MTEFTTYTLENSKATFASAHGNMKGEQRTEFWASAQRGSVHTSFDLMETRSMTMLRNGGVAVCEGMGAAAFVMGCHGG